MPISIAGSRRLSLRLRFAAALGAGMFLIALTLIGWQLVSRFDADAQRRAIQMVQAGVQAMRHTNKMVARDYAHWSEAYRALREQDVDWLDSNLGSRVDITGTMDVVVLAGGGLDEPLGWVHADKGPLGAMEFAEFAESARMLVQLRDHRPHQTPVSSYLYVNGKLWLMSVDFVLPHGVAPADGADLGLLIVAERFSAREKTRLSDILLIDGMLISAVADGTPGTAPDRDAIILNGVDRPIASLSWPLPRPGNSALRSIALPLASVLLIAIGAFLYGLLSTARMARGLETALIAAQAADRTKAAFIATLSHELRTPMNGVIGMLQILETTELTELQQDCVKVASQSADAQLILIEHLLSFSAMDAPDPGMKLQPVNPITLLHDIAAQFTPVAEAKGLRINVGSLVDTHSGTNSGTDTDADMLGHAVELRQIVTNLVDNAIKFTQHGEVTLSARLHPEKGGFRLRIQVDDTGPGIPEPLRERVFDSFLQLDSSATRSASGVGLGLAIARKLARQMGGELFCTASDTAGGARFVLDIPLRSGAAGRAQGLQTAA